MSHHPRQGPTALSPRPAHPSCPKVMFSLKRRLSSRSSCVMWHHFSLQGTSPFGTTDPPGPPASPSPCHQGHGDTSGPAGCRSAPRAGWAQVRTPPPDLLFWGKRRATRGRGPLQLGNSTATPAPSSRRTCGAFVLGWEGEQGAGRAKMLEHPHLQHLSPQCRGVSSSQSAPESCSPNTPPPLQCCRRVFVPLIPVPIPSPLSG